MQLRPYQEEAVSAVLADWQTHGAVLGVAATGAGKTQILLEVLNRAHQQGGGRSLVLAHRQELIDQPIERVAGWAGWTIPMGKVMASHDDCQQPITIATVQTLASTKRLARLLAFGAIDRLVIDETHHATARTYLELVERLRMVNPNLRILGVTATPIRADGDGLSRLFEHVSFRITIADLVKQHYLVQPRWLGIATGISLKGVESRAGDYVQSQLASRFDTEHGRRIILQAYQDYASGRRAIAFTASVQGAHELAGAFIEAGIPAAAVDGTTPKEERARLLQAYREGRITVLANCQVLTEGFDAPGTSCVLMCRPTKSDSLYIQCMGRGLRPAPRADVAPDERGKALPGEDCLILDFMPQETRNIVMAGDVLGLPKDQAKAARQLVEETEAEPGEVQLGFTFDGSEFDHSGTPLEIVARQINYLQASPWTWDRRDDWMVLGLGKGADGIDRILAITPPDATGTAELWGLGRGEGEWSWRRRRLATGTLEELGAQANEIADRQGAHTLIGKGRQWQREGATEGQIKYLRRLAPVGHRSGLAALTKGEAAHLITYWQARAALFDVVSVSVGEPA